MATVSLMRWRFIDPHNLQEVSERNAMLTKIDDWWQEFQAEQRAIAGSFTRFIEFDLVGWMNRHLESIHPDLMWEYGPAIHQKGDRLVITPESAHHLRPMVRTILERAPVIDGWEFYEHRLPEAVASAISTVRARTQRDVGDFKVRVTRGDDHLIDLTYTAPSIVDADARSASSAAFVATETLLGEACLDNWTGLVEATPTPPTRGFGRFFVRTANKQRHFVELGRLRETVHALIGSIRDQLPRKPLYESIEGAKGTVWKLTPNEADDYAEQQDMFVGRSVSPAMWMAARSSRTFCSERFSRCDETFCYVKLDGSEGLDEDHFADKSEIEDALDEVLRPAVLGCTIGGGTGRRYSYIDLALTDVDKGIAAIKRRLQAGNVPKRSWIQFFDSDLAAEWVGIYDDTPQPPLAVS